LYYFAKHISEKPCNHSGLFMEAQCIITSPVSLLWYCGTFGLAPFTGCRVAAEEKEKDQRTGQGKISVRLAEFG
jgi:hypothetical protein